MIEIRTARHLELRLGRLKMAALGGRWTACRRARNEPGLTGVSRHW